MLKDTPLNPKIANLTKRFIDQRMERDRMDLEFAVGFANQNLDSLRLGDLLNLQEDFMVWFGISETESAPKIRVRGSVSKSGHINISPSAWVLDMQRKDFQELQRHVCDILDYKETTFELKSGINLNQGPFMTIEAGSVHDAFILKLAITLQFNPDRIMRCAQCGKFFYRIKLQKYCSRECTLKVNYKSWYEHHKRHKKSARKTKRAKRRK